MVTMNLFTLNLLTFICISVMPAKTYHWKCMRELGCSTDGQRQEIDTADTWDCPVYACLNNAQK
eukprot:1158851-Pelagomonas_calceolata.AAC.10